MSKIGDDLGPWGQLDTKRREAQEEIGAFAGDRVRATTRDLWLSLTLYVVGAVLLLGRPSTLTLGLAIGIAGYAVFGLYLDRSKIEGLKLAQKIAGFGSGPKIANVQCLMQLAWATLILRIVVLCTYAGTVATYISTTKI